MSSPSTLNSIAATTSPGLFALLQHAAFNTLDSIGWVRVTGEDRVRWLNGMVTNSIQTLAPGQGCYSFALNAQGRIQGDLVAWMLDDSILLETSRPAELAAWLERYIIMDDVELAVVASKGILVAGPDAANEIARIFGSVELPQPMHFAMQPWQGSRLEIFHAASPLLPRFEIWSEDAAALAKVEAALLAQRVARARPDDLEYLRLLEGTPLFGVDIRDKDLPQETAQTRALHFNKGCYLGQEIVERIHSRGAVHRTFSGFMLSGDLPPAGTRLLAADTPDRPAGELTSAARIDLPGGAINLALGYVRRDLLERGVALIYPGGTAAPVAVPFAAGLIDESGLPNPASEAIAATGRVKKT